MTLYERLLGASFAELGARNRSLLSGGERAEARGVCTVGRGAGPLARHLATALRLPEAGADVPVRLTIERHGETERWTRTFGERTLATRQGAIADLLYERFGPLELRLRPEVVGGALHFHTAGVFLRAGPLAFPLPRFLGPDVEARSWDESDRIRVTVTLTLPVVGLLLAYYGAIQNGGTNP